MKIKVFVTVCVRVCHFMGLNKKCIPSISVTLTLGLNHIAFFFLKRPWLSNQITGLTRLVINYLVLNCPFA